MSTTTVKYSVYVGTYKKYNEGSLFGTWLDLSDSAAKEEFYIACRALHMDEDDPEFMFQDFEGVPRSMMSESSIDEEVWEMLELDEDDLEALGEWMDNGNDFDIDRFRDAFQGNFDNEKDYADHCAKETGMYDVMEKAGIDERYFDLDTYSYDLFNGDCWISDTGNVFICS